MLKDPCFAVSGSMRNPAQYQRIASWLVLKPCLGSANYVNRSYVIT